MTLLHTDEGFVVPAAEFNALKAERDALTAELARAREETGRYGNEIFDAVAARVKSLESELARAREANERHQKERDYSVRWANRSVDSIREESLARIEAAVERAFRDGVAYGTTTRVTDIDEAWRTSAVRAELMEAKP